MYSVNKKQQLKDFANAIAVPIGLTDNAKWPVRAGTVIYPVRNILVRELLSQIEKAELVGNADKWRKAFNNPTQLWRMSHHLISGLLDDKSEKSKIAETILVLLEGIAALSNNHYFERIGNHLIFDESTLAETVNVPLIDGKAEARSILALCGIVWAYSETNFFVAHELTCEYHGAYSIGNGKFAVVRDFINLSPTELWSERDFAGLPNKIRAVTIHDCTLDIGFDAYNNLFDDNGTMGQSLIGGAVTSDGKVLSIGEICSLTGIFANKVTAFANEIDAMTKNEIARKYMEVFWYRKKSLTDYLGIDWNPSDELYSVLEEGLLTPPPKKTGQKKETGRTPVEQLAVDFNFSEYVN